MVAAVAVAPIECLRIAAIEAAATATATVAAVAEAAALARFLRAGWEAGMY